MDICFKAFQGERIGKMVEDAVSVPAKPQLSSTRVLPRPAVAYGDFSVLPWCVAAARTGSPRKREDVDVAA